MGEILKLHAAQNFASWDSWEVFESHRNRVTRLVLDSAEALRSAGSSGLSLAVLGAGNGNDLLVAPLLEVFDSIDLFDLDAEAIERNRSRFLDKPEVLERVRWIDSVDLSGIVTQLERNREQALPIDDALIEAARQPAVAAIDRQYDVVLSTCTLTQLIQSVVEIYGGDTPEAQALILAVRDGHLALMMRLMKSTAAGLLVTDFVNSDTLPALLEPKLDEERLFGLVDQAIREHNFFSGANPLAIRQRLDGMLRSVRGEARMNLTPPWVWRFEQRACCVAALQFF